MTVNKFGLFTLVVVFSLLCIFHLTEDELLVCLEAYICPNFCCKNFILNFKYAVNL